MLLSLNDSTFLNVTVLFEIFLAIYIFLVPGVCLVKRSEIFNGAIVATE